MYVCLCVFVCVRAFFLYVNRIIRTKTQFNLTAYLWIVVNSIQNVRAIVSVPIHCEPFFGMCFQNIPNCSWPLIFLFYNFVLLLPKGRIVWIWHLVSFVSNAAKINFVAIHGILVFVSWNPNINTINEWHFGISAFCMCDLWKLILDPEVNQ